jgi:conserved hypothetical protein
MLIIFIRALILFAVLLFVFRLMGKRQIGEMEPFELVITLVISELACIPMADRSIPITFGVVAILTMFVIHQTILLLAKSNAVQSLISGKPVMVIDSQGIDAKALAKLNMHVNDLLQAMRSVEYFSLEEVRYGIMETNGQLTIVPNKQMSDMQQTLPVPIITEGQWCDDDMQNNGFTKEKIVPLLAARKVKSKDVLLLAIDENNRATLQTKKGSVQFFNAEVAR